VLSCRVACHAGRPMTSGRTCRNRSVIWALNLRLSQTFELLAKARGAHAVERASRRSYLATSILQC
jgi:hypothetical protein